jgi:hypothetical protein
MTIPCGAVGSLERERLLSDAISESAEQHQESEEGEDRQRAAPDQQAPRPLATGHLSTR